MTPAKPLISRLCVKCQDQWIPAIQRPQSVLAARLAATLRGGTGQSRGERHRTNISPVA